MRRLALLLGFTIAAPAAAGMYHAGENTYCGDCHTLHARMAQPFDRGAPARAVPESAAGGTWLPDRAARGALLARPTTRTCVSCHDGSTWAPDVVGPNVNANVRSAGFLPVPGVADDEHRGHSLGFSGTAPGSSTTFTDFTCIDCHSPHGKPDAFRNLNAFSPGGGPVDPRYPRFYLGATPFSSPGETPADVRIDASYDFSVPGAAVFQRHLPYYSNDKVFLERGGQNELDHVCERCHGRFHENAPVFSWTGTQSGHDVFQRHPTGRLITSPAGSTNAPSFTTRVYAAPAGSYVGCLSCHRAHGTGNPFGLVYATRAVRNAPNALDDSESGSRVGQTAGLAGTCTSCHATAR